MKLKMIKEGDVVCPHCRLDTLIPSSFLDSSLQNCITCHAVFKEIQDTTDDDIRTTTEVKEKDLEGLEKRKYKKAYDEAFKPHENKEK